MEKGLIQVYSGEGHGKSAAALGRAVQMASMGRDVVIINFQGDQMIIHTNSEKIIEIVPYIQSAGCAYDIEPPFPHKID